MARLATKPARTWRDGLPGAAERSRTGTVRGTTQEWAPGSRIPIGMRRSALAVLAVVALAAPAAASHKKPFSETYTVTAPVPYPVDGASHCADAPEGHSRHTKPLRLPDRGELELRLSDFAGDWVLELFDDKGRMLAQLAEFDPLNTGGNVLILKYKKATPGQQVRILVCNVTGGPTARVRYTFTYR